MKKLTRLSMPLLALALLLGAASTPRARSAPRAATTAYLPRLVRSQPVLEPVLKWAYGGCFTSWCQTGWYASPAAVQLDGDPQLEVLGGGYDLAALDGLSGSLEWRAVNSNRIWPGIGVADLGDDGGVEIVVGRGGDLLTVYDLSGEVVWDAHPFGYGELRTLALADLEDDGLVEIIVGRAAPGSTRQLSVYEPDGSVRPGWPARRDGEVGYGWGMYNQNAAAADLDGDGIMEIIGPTDTHYITALYQDGDQIFTHSMYDDSYPEGRKVWSQVGVHVDHEVDLRGYAECGEEHRPNFADSAPAIADLDGNGVNEVVVVGNVYNCATSPYTSLYQMVFIFNGDRSRWSSPDYNWTEIPAPEPDAAPLSEEWEVIETAAPNPAIADLDGDGEMEILFASYDGRLHAYWLDKTQHGEWPYAVHDPREGFTRFASEPVVADLNGDGLAEVIFASWTEKGSSEWGRLHVLNFHGLPLFELELPAARSGDWNGALAAPTLANVDLDDDLELILNTAHSGVLVYDLPGTSGAQVLWGTGRGGFLRSGTPPGQD